MTHPFMAAACALAAVLAFRLLFLAVFRAAHVLGFCRTCGNIIREGDRCIAAGSRLFCSQRCELSRGDD